MKNERLLAGAILALAVQSAVAGPSADEARLLATLKRAYPATTFTSVAASEVPGIYEVWMGPNVAFVSPKSPRYFIMGRLLDAKTATDITGPKLARAQAARPAVDTADSTDRPIDIAKLASRLKTEGDIVFARLYYHFEEKFGYTRDDGTHVYFFANSITIGPDREIHCINFPYMCAALAELREEHHTTRTNMWLALASALFAALSAVAAFYAMGSNEG